ncbi:hypothetical protein [Streptomyces hilarionis]|uniref:hypothetical protein n=1 Tax=Streptomyces hilarionis TaxID=2839954 RepID=UPI002119B8DC|nr:hypothetical protein [Streptomyces hilarionis]MCQ9131422.1 hypothetical protein [Streptomyces hilarionis]
MNSTGRPELDHRPRDRRSEAPPVCPVMRDRLRNDHFQRLRALGLPRDDFVVAGSAPLFVRGLRDHVSDLDVVARGAGWRRARTLATPVPAPYGRGTVLSVGLADQRIEILNAWFPKLFGPVDRIIESAEVIEGIRFLSLSDTLRWKDVLRRPKDVHDLAVADSRGRPGAGRPPEPALPAWARNTALRDATAQWRRRQSPAAAFWDVC